MKVVAGRIQSLMVKRGVTTYKLAKETGVSYTGVFKILSGATKNPQMESLSAIADFFGVSVDYLLGQSVKALIEKRLEQRGMTLEDLSEQTKIPLVNLQNLDSMTPAPWDYEKDGLIDHLAKTLKISRKVLASAFARQKPPVYDAPTLSPEEVFKQIQDDFADENFDEIQTIAAHHDGEDWTEEELEDIERFKAFIKSKRQ